MKKLDLKLRVQWGFFKAALAGAVVAVLITPTSRSDVFSILDEISFGPKVKVVINGDVVALAKNTESAKEAFKAARLAYNAEGIRILDLEVSYEALNKETDAEQTAGMHALRGEKLTAAIFNSFDKYGEADKELAYTMRIDDYTVTVEHMEDLVSILEEAQGAYDAEDAFKVGLNAPASRNTTMYEVSVTGKESGEVEAEPVLAEVSTERETTTEPIAAGVSTGETDSQTDALAQAANDGVKYVGFSETIQVMETYVGKSQVKDRDTAYNEITAKNAEASIYVVEPGDCLSIIAEKNEMSVEEIKELNPQIESDDDIYYDDRLNITVPTAAVQILVEKQETYKEDYNEDIVYEDDDSMYIGETEVIREGVPGKHTVTDLVTYKDDLEYGREQLQETIEVAAVAPIVRRGTKSKPTYMFPVTNWNVTSNFGYRWGRLHAGTDVGVPTGTTVRASRSGQVITAGWVGGYGNCVMIDHGDGVCTLYGHLSEIGVSVGQYVNQGEQVALSGNTGRSTGPHLHFEIRVNGGAVDPLPYLYQTQ